MAACKACGKELLFLRHYKTKKIMPVEAEKVDDGNIVVNLPTDEYRIATGEEWERAKTQNIKLHISHFARCPKAAGFRK